MSWATHPELAPSKNIPVSALAAILKMAAQNPHTMLNACVLLSFLSISGG